VWSTIIDGILQDPEIIKNDNTQKQFIVNLESDEIFDLFESYKLQTLDQSIEIKFPTIYKNENEHIYIILDIRRAFGKQRCNTRWIMLSPENISKDIINSQKIEHFKCKIITKFESIDCNMHKLETFVNELNKKIINIEKNICDINERLTIIEKNTYDLQNKTENTYDIETVDTEIGCVRYDLTFKYDALNAKVNELLEKYTNIDKFKNSVIEICDSKYQLKF